MNKRFNKGTDYVEVSQVIPDGLYHVHTCINGIHSHNAFATKFACNKYVKGIINSPFVGI